VLLGRLTTNQVKTLAPCISHVVPIQHDYTSHMYIAHAMRLCHLHQDSNLLFLYSISEKRFVSLLLLVLLQHIVPKAFVIVESEMFLIAQIYFVDKKTDQ